MGFETRPYKRLPIMIVKAYQAARAARANSLVRIHTPHKNTHSRRPTGQRGSLTGPKERQHAPQDFGPR